MKKTLVKMRLGSLTAILTARIYLGVREYGACQVIAIDNCGQPNRVARHLPLRRDLSDHSATFGWGYQGPGPAQLALALLADYLDDDDLAVALHKEFARSFIAHLDGNIWLISADQLTDLLLRLVAEQNPLREPIMAVGGRRPMQRTADRARAAERRDTEAVATGSSRHAPDDCTAGPPATRTS